MEYSDGFVSAIVEMALKRFVRAVRVADENGKSLVGDAVNSFLHLGWKAAQVT